MVDLIKLLLDILWSLLIGQSQQALSIKIVNILSFVDFAVSVSASQVCWCSARKQP